MTNLLKNASFEENPTSHPTQLTGKGHGGLAAAPQWGTWNNQDATTTTDVLPSTRRHGGFRMLHVCTTAAGNGLVQGFLAPDQGPRRTRSSVWVFVVRGQVGMGTGNGGNTHDYDARSSTVGGWERLSAPNGVAPANEFVVYAVSPEGACFYVDDACVEAAP